MKTPNLRPRLRGFRVLAPAALLTLAAWAAVPVEPPRNPHASDAWRLPAGEPVFPADEEAMPLRKHCQLCHSADYVTTQPRLGRKAWEASVEKMRTRYGAPIPTNAVPGIVDYLVKHHGTP